MRTARIVCLLAIAVSARAGVTTTLDDYFTRAAAHGFSGSVVVARGNEILLRKGYGLAARRARVPAGPQTAYNIGSRGERVMGAAILELEAAGRLRTADRRRRFSGLLRTDKWHITLRRRLSN